LNGTVLLKKLLENLKEWTRLASVRRVWTPWSSESGSKTLQNSTYASAWTTRHWCIAVKSTP